MRHIADKSGSMAEALAAEIRNGVYRAGSRLPGERVLCDYFKVSRTTARAVLGDFEKRGIIFRKARFGAYVCERAVEIIEGSGQGSGARVCFLMPPSQQVNPLLRTLFSTFAAYAGPDMRISVAFTESNAEILPLSVDKADTVILFGFGELAERLSAGGRRVIVLNRSDKALSYVSPDNYEGGRIMGRHLLERGYRDIRCPLFGADDPGSDFSQRFAGLKDALEGSGAVLTTCAIASGREMEADAYAALLSSGVERGFAVACLTDKAAMAVYACLQSRGLKIPDDAGVIGFDDQYYSCYVEPGLTTVKYPAEAMGKLLADYLRNSNADACLREKVTPMLVERHSLK